MPESLEERPALDFMITAISKEMNFRGCHKWMSPFYIWLVFRSYKKDLKLDLFEDSCIMDEVVVEPE